MPSAYNGAMFRSPARSPRWAAVIVALVLLVPPLHASAREAVTLQLKWRHAFQFAGYYAAKEKGFYDAAGLDVHLQEATPGMDPVEPVLNGQAQYGVGNSSLLLARRAGQPVVVLAVVFQHSPLVLLTRQQPDTADAQSLQHLAGKRVMIEPHSDELIAYLKREGVPLDQLVQVPHSYRPEDLIEGRHRAGKITGAEQGSCVRHGAFERNRGQGLTGPGDKREVARRKGNDHTSTTVHEQGGGRRKRGGRSSDHSAAPGRGIE